MKRESITTQRAPAALGPYSQAIQTDGLIFVSGQLGLDPKSGELSGDITAQTEQALANLSAILQEAGSSLEKIVKTTIFLANMGDFSTVNAIYAASFSDVPPARSTIEVAALPLSGLIEIEAIALTN